MNMVSGDKDILSILREVEEKGYVFVDDYLTIHKLNDLQQEIDSLPLEAGDHIHFPINKNQSNEVKQYHHRFYCPIGDKVPIATQFCYDLRSEVASYNKIYPELNNWLLSEVGYQRYYAPRDWISPHRDRSSDKFLSVTFTIVGSAWIHIYEPLTNPPDYTKIDKIDSHLTKPGTALFLRAPGLGSGKQIIHEVMPPLTEKRDILNLRMRPTILKPPMETKWKM